MSACICRRHAVRMDCPVHGDERYREDFRRIVVPAEPTVLDDPEWQDADRERWERTKALGEGSS